MTLLMCSFQHRDFPCQHTPHDQNQNQSQSPIEESVDTIFSGFSVHVSSDRVFIIGGGGIFYWMPHFNQSIWCDLPQSIQKDLNSSEVQNAEKKKRRPEEEHIVEEKKPKLEEKKEFVLRVQDKRMVFLSFCIQLLVKNSETFLRT